MFCLLVSDTERPATAAGERRWSAGATAKSPATRKRSARRLFAVALLGLFLLLATLFVSWTSSSFIFVVKAFVMSTPKRSARTKTHQRHSDSLSSSSRGRSPLYSHRSSAAMTATEFADIVEVAEHQFLRCPGTAMQPFLQL